MAVASPATDHEVRKTVVYFLRGIDFADRLWFRADHGHLTFWLTTKPVSHERERAVYRVSGLVYERVPDARFDFVVFNPAMYEAGEYTFTPPLGAEEIPLR